MGLVSEFKSLYSHDVPINNVVANDGSLQLVIENALQGLRNVSPSPPPSATLPRHERVVTHKISRPIKPKVARPVTRQVRRPPCLLPTASDPMDPSFLASLYSESDVGKINPVHEVIRRDVLEVRHTISGRVFFQCGCCKHLPRKDRANLSTIAPRSVNGIYRSFVRFMMEHVSACEHIPAHMKQMRAKSSRDIGMRPKEYWIASAHKLGLRDYDGNIVYVLP